jgi:hypothetical protein
MDMLASMSGETKTKGSSSLWTTPVTASSEPLKEAAIDQTVSAAELLQAVDAARQRAATFIGNVTEALLRKSF